MITDYQNTYDNQRAITSTCQSAGYLDKPSGSLGFGPGGRRNFLVVQCVQTFNNTTNIGFEWQTSANSSFNDSLPDIDSRTILVSNLVAGGSSGLNYLYAVAAPDSGINQWTRMQYTVNGSSAPTSGSITAFITDQTDGYNAVSLSSAY